MKKVATGPAKFHTTATQILYTTLEKVSGFQIMYTNTRIMKHKRQRHEAVMIMRTCDDSKNSELFKFSVN